MNTRRRLPLRLAASLLMALVLLLSACGDADQDAATTDETAGDTTTVVDGELDNSLVGLEVTVSGNVSEVIDDNAFRIDKDGLGGATDTSGEEAIEDYESDYFDGDEYFYDYRYGTAYDDEFGDADVLDEGAIVLDVSPSDLALDQGVRVNGTIRRFAEDTLEDVYDVDLDDDVYDDYEDHLVLVAEDVKPMPSQDSGGSESAQPSTTPSMAPTQAPSEG